MQVVAAALFILLLCTSTVALADVALPSDVDTSVETLPDVVIEGQAPPVEEQKSTTVRVPIGQGAKSIDADRNELGIEIKNMERLSDLSSERRNDPWWLSEGPYAKEWQQQVHGDLSLDQKLKARARGRIYGLKTDVEAGASQDHRDLILEQNTVNPYDSSYDHRQNFANQNDTSYGQIKVQARSAQGLGDIDQSQRDVYAGSLLTGTQSAKQESLNGQWRAGRLQILPFAQARQKQFSSSLSPLYSNATTDLRSGSQASFEDHELGARLESSLSYETLTRTYTDNSATHFNRFDLCAKGSQSRAFEYLELSGHVGGEFAHDQIDATAAPTLSARGINEASEPFVWDAGAEVSSSHRYSTGAVARVRRFALLPTPSQRFGDGALLVGSSDLPPETGYRASFGPWAKTAAFDLELAGFFEREINAPVMAAVSPTAARTLAIGGVWSRGAELNGAAHFGFWTTQFRYSWQESLNDSDISWQKGEPIPGRPQHIFSTGYSYARAGWKHGLNYEYQSAQALDFAGLWFKPPHHDLSLYVGYGTKAWEVRLTGAKLLAEINGLPSTQFAGQAAPNLLEPTIEQTEIRLQCEFLM